MSKLEYTPDQIKQIESNLAGILEMMKDLQDVQIPNDLTLPEGVHISALREDIVVDNDDDCLSNAPKVKDGCYVAPLVVE